VGLPKRMGPKKPRSTNIQVIHLVTGQAENIIISFQPHQADQMT